MSNYITNQILRGAETISKNSMTNTTDTPRTDDRCYHYDSKWKTMTISPFGEHIEAAFSRQLERELNESKEETEDLIFDLEKSRAEVERLQSQLNRSIEIADELSSGDAWKFTAADEKLTELKKEIK